jgi:predicted transposase YbfD/YdcC
MKLFFAILITLSLSSAFWICYHAKVRQENTGWKVENSKMVEEVAKHRADAAKARKDKNAYIKDVVEGRR